ncbi:MAG: protein-methionine-sulfoxide reductase catalytic subunit MsrP [Acidobacteria bacterium]|nr:protein-methionine-sulfoxide reductase catalytic subunit MsrP [Acidobacteriota bacterium]
MVIKKHGDILSSEITDEHLFLNRRNFVRAAVLAGTTTATALLYRRFAIPAPVPAQVAANIEGVKSSTPDVAVPPPPADARTPYEKITNYNNYYEFTTDKEDVARLARNFTTRPWTVEVGGLVQKPKTFDIDDLIKLAPQEERVYRFRCVEGWSMIIPWVGFPLAKLLSAVEPLGGARYVAFESVVRPKEMPGQREGTLDFPYVEGLRLDEAMHPLTILATGIYGKVLLPQNGAPVRLVVPWKYGFKSAKAIVKITLTEREPPTTWNLATPSEYGFYSNVNPQVDHPRWSQATEQRIGEFGRRDTLMFNGYADEVAQLYAGMDLRRYF